MPVWKWSLDASPSWRFWVSPLFGWWASNEWMNSSSTRCFYIGSVAMRAWPKSDRKASRYLPAENGSRWRWFRPPPNAGALPFRFSRLITWTGNPHFPREHSKPLTIASRSSTFTFWLVKVLVSRTRSHWFAALWGVCCFCESFAFGQGKVKSSFHSAGDSLATGPDYRPIPADIGRFRAVPDSILSSIWALTR